jgi:hypothetical protein
VQNRCGAPPERPFLFGGTDRAGPRTLERRVSKNAVPDGGPMVRITSLQRGVCCDLTPLITGSKKFTESVAEIAPVTSVRCQSERRRRSGGRRPVLHIRGRTYCPKTPKALLSGKCRLTRLNISRTSKKAGSEFCTKRRQSYQHLGFEPDILISATVHKEFSRATLRARCSRERRRTVKDDEPSRKWRLP